jgi:hypothetical protein
MEGIIDKIVARLNIERFRNRLAEETDKITRQTLIRLLAEEEAKLVAPMHPPKETESRH